MGVLHKAHPDWATFIPPLLLAFELTDEPVLELGMGMFSTPLLHVLCASQDRLLASFDNDGRFIEQFKNFATEDHKIYLDDGWTKFPELHLGFDWSLALVDHKPAIQRKEDIKRLTGVDYVVVHDTQERADEYYGFEEIYPLFKYRYDYTKFANQTTVLSNKHDLDFFHYSLD